jgi:hypothetical protein
MKASNNGTSARQLTISVFRANCQNGMSIAKNLSITSTLPASPFPVDHPK